MINESSEEIVIYTIMSFLKENKDQAFNIKELAKIANIFPIDAEMCLRELSKEDIVMVKWIDKIENNEIVDYELYFAFNKDLKSKEKKGMIEPPDLMYR